MKFYEVERTIAASPARVWEALTDPLALVGADTGIARIEGRIGAEQKFKLWTDASAREYSLKVSEFDPPRRMVWTGGLPLGLFKGVREFELTAVPGGTEFRMREEFSGLMLPLIWKSMPDLGPSFKQFAAALDTLATGVTA